MARSVWALAKDDKVEHMIMTRVTNAKLWLATMHDSLQQEDFTEMVVTLWAVWYACRKAIYEQDFNQQCPLICLLNTSYLRLTPPPTSRKSIHDQLGLTYENRGLDHQLER